MPYIDFGALRAQLDIADVLALLDWEATGYDANGARGPCPIHGSTSPTSRIFSVSLQGQMFRCFKCGAHGNALDLYAQATGQSIYRAARQLADEFALDV